ncbi:hypothetical protein NE237_015709 [Protea cynaroides]|uniref:HSF-type DNA-binding domain-containing protein n=1 Tax=Protea cynaroides TaxID=273540 RepID=A0A9Q0KEB7_9MAGN|nr:hypothetical protein NE237_015709 [Protea cynaroides]
MKEEFPEGSSSYLGEPPLFTPQPMEGLNELGPPAFLTKTFDMVDDPNTNHLVYWSIAGNSFVVWDPQTFSMIILPRYFKHCNFSSFIRQLNTYGFRKVDPDKWEFANEGFLRGQKHLLKNVKRKKASSQPISQQQDLGPCLEMEGLELDAEVDQLRHDKEVLMMEVLKLRQQQQDIRVHLRVMEQRLKGTEMKQQQMMTIFARAIRNPAFIQQLTRHKERKRKLDEATITNKRRRPIDQGLRNVFEVGGSSKSGGKKQNLINVEPENLGDLEMLAMQMQGLSKARMEPKTEFEGEECKLFDEEFWEELMNEELDEEDDVNISKFHLGSYSHGGK